MKSSSLIAIVFSLATSACAVDPSDPSESTAEAESDLTQLVFYEKFDNLSPGGIDGQNGWSGNCTVVADPLSTVRGQKYLKCRGLPDGTYQGAQRNTNTGLEASGDYYMQFDVWPNLNVVDATHGKLFIEGPEGAVFQIVVGNNNIRGAFEYYGNTTRTLLSFPPATQLPLPVYRVICKWQSWGTAIRCGAAVFPDDPQEPNGFVDIPAIDGNGAPDEIRPFDHVRVLGGIGGRPGATLFDKIYIERN